MIAMACVEYLFVVVLDHKTTDIGTSQKGKHSVGPTTMANNLRVDHSVVLNVNLGSRKHERSGEPNQIIEVFHLFRRDWLLSDQKVANRCCPES